MSFGQILDKKRDENTWDDKTRDDIEMTPTKRVPKMKKKNYPEGQMANTNVIAETPSDRTDTDRQLVPVYRGHAMEARLLEGWFLYICDVNI